MGDNTVLGALKQARFLQILAYPQIKKGAVLRPRLNHQRRMEETIKTVLHY